MFTRFTSIHRTITRRLLISVFIFTLISLAAAGSNAAGISFIDSVREFLGIQTAQVSLLQDQPTGPNNAWFDSAWTYRRPVTVSNGGATLTDYQVLITLDASFDFSRANSGGSDLRFISDSGSALPFWIESWDSTGNLARVWVKIPSIPIGNSTIYLYYGNPIASSASNGGNTFEFFDDDWASLSTRWTINGGTPIVNSGIVAFSSGATMQSRTFYSPGHALGFRGWFKSGGGAYKWGGFLNGVNTPYTYIGTVGDSGYPNVILTNNTSGTRRASDLGVLTGAFHFYELTWSTTATRAFLDRAVSPAGSLTQDIPTSSLPIQLGNYNDSRSTFEVDWVYLRKFRESEPTLAVGVEEGNQSADLSLTLNDGPDPIMVNELLTYSLAITNNGPLDATGVLVTDTLPSTVNFNSASASQGTCSGTTTVACDLGSIASGNTVTVSIIVTPTSSGTIVNAASVSGSLPDPNTANNNASTSTIVNDPTTTDLGITQTASPDPVKVGTTLTYQLVVINNGPANATGVTVGDILPLNVTYVLATSDHGTCSHPGAVSCDLGTLNSGSTAHITITVTPNSVGTITNQASVSGTEQDPFTTNNSTTATTRVSAPSLGAVVLVNSNSSAFVDFQHYIQPYLDNFGVPYTVLDIANAAVDTDVMDYAVIIIGHGQIDVGNSCSGGLCLSSSEQTNITNAVNAGTGLINFDNDLSADGSTARYQFIQDIFNFSYAAAPSGSGVLFTPAAGSHYITERHQTGESIGTGSMALADVALPGDATTLATTGGAPFLAVRNSGQGRAVQWGTYNWMSVSVKGPVYGLDDLVWRSMAWAARKPFIMQGMPPFLTMRVDDESGPFDWIHVANEVGIKPWAGVFLSNIDESEAADLSSLVNAGQATTSIHAFNGSWFYWNQTDAQIAANFVTGTQWHQTHNIPISKYVLPHYYQFGSNSFAGMADWGVQCVGTQMDPDQGYGASWIMSGPYRKYETGSSSGGTPQYSADYMTIPGHPEFNGRFFNLVTEIRDDLGYEWYPNNDVPGTIGHGTLQTKRALDSMVLATLFTHDQSVSGISMNNWRSILQGITANIAPYHPINVTMDEACQYIKSKHDSTIVGSSYDAATRRVTVNYSGVTQVPTKYYLFMDDHGAIRDMWVDVPQFSGTTQVLFTLPGELHHIVVTPAAPTVVTEATQQFVAQGFDAGNNPIPNLPVAWSVANGGGTINSSGLFTAGPTPGTYNNTIVASVGSITGTASVTVVAPTLDHFNFQTIASPQYIGAPFQINITARDASNNLFTGYTGQANLSASVGSITPVVTGNFSNGSWTGTVSLDQAAGSVTLTASAGGSNGISNSFAVLAAPTLDHFTIQTIASPQIVNAPFQVTITAWDASNNPLPVYAGHPNLNASVGSITPAVTGDFIGGSWTGTVSLSQIAANVTITVSDGTATATSNAFAVQAPPPYYQLTSPSYVQTTGVPFTVNVAAYQATINAWEDNHQDPVLTTTSDLNTLNYNAANGQWTEFLYTPSRPFPTILASVLHTTNLPTMRFYLSGIPNGRYRVIANLYDNARMRYFFGYTSADPLASYVDTLGGATGTQHREYSLGTVDVTTNSFNLFVKNAQLLGGDYEMFGWAWIRLLPAEPTTPSDITINLWESNHQEPVLATTTDVPTLVSNSANHLWTEFLYTTSRPYPSVMGSALHTPVTPTMHFYSNGIPNGQYQVYANLYDTNPLRYFYGYTSADPNALYVDTTGATTGGTQHREYSLGTVNITNGSFDLYVNRADQLPGATYDIFGWAWIRLSPQFVPLSNLTLSSSSATMQFDASGNGVFGEAGDNVKTLTNGSLSIPARDTAPGPGIVITVTDFLGQTGSNIYTFQSPTASLTVTKDGSGSGTVTSDPAGIDCGATCTADFATSTVVTLAAAADISSVFTGWSGSNCSGTGTCVVTVDGAKSVTATYAINAYTMAYDGNGNTGGTAPVDISSPYNYNSTVTVLGSGSLVKTGYTFAHWNTAMNNGGTTYVPGATFPATANTTLYAQWTINPPTLGTYPAKSVVVSGDTTVTPSAVPTGATAINVSTSTSFNGRLEADPVTGVVRVTNAHPAGVYIVTVTAFNSGAVTTEQPLTLTVTNGTACSGNVSFTNAADVSAGTRPSSVAIGDFNNDSRQDIAVASIGSNSVSIGLGDGSGGFAAAANVNVGSEPFGVAVGDLNGDGRQDLAVSNVESNSVSIRLGNGDGTFTGTTNVGVGYYPYSVAIGDFDNDAKRDIATANYFGMTVSVRLGDGSGGFGGTTEVPLGDLPYSLAVGDFNQDGKQDIAAAKYESGTIAILLGNGTGGFAAAADANIGYHPFSVAIGDFNNDGKQDIAAANLHSNAVTVRLGAGTGGFGSTTSVNVGTNPYWFAIGDFNNDGKHDIAAANTNSNTVSVRMGDGSGGFTGATDVGTGSTPWSIAVGDFNNDGRQDFAATSSGSSNVWVRLGGCTPVVDLSVSTNAGSEADTTAITVTATASDPVAGDQTVGLGVTGTNITGGDYTLSSGTIPIPNGATTGSVTFTVVNDLVYEGTETATLTISSPSAGLALGATTTQDVTITDNDHLLTYTAGANGSITGTSPQTVNYGSDGTLVTATPNLGYHFVSWSDAYPTADRIDVNVTHNVNATASFALDEYTLSIISDHGTVTRVPAKPTYHYGDAVTLRAAAETGWTFTGWSGDASGTTNPLDLTITGDTDIVANYAFNRLIGNVAYRSTTTPVPDTRLTVTGPTPLPTPVLTDMNGYYSMSGFGLGSYTLTPSKPGYPVNVSNGIFADDASLISQHVVHRITLTPDQIEAGKVSGLSSLTSFDAALIAQYIVGIPNTLNRTGTWKFAPASMTQEVTPDTVCDFSSILKGDVNGDWPAIPLFAATESELVGPAGSVRVSVPDTESVQGSVIVVPLRIDNLNGREVDSYQFDIEYDPAVIEPAGTAASLADPFSESHNVVSNAPVPGLLKVVVYGAVPVTGDGVYVNLRFSTLGAPGSTSPLNIRGFRLNDGLTPIFTTNGSLTITAANDASIRGRLLSAMGQPVENARIVLTGTTGESYTAVSNLFGYFEFSGLTIGETYTVSVRSKQYTFSPVTVSVTTGVTVLEIIADQ